ncbi:hypothetical protein [Actinoplanes regularis]|uniref:hypothetical protein n=1 Tax=Actinoplanes regularis TaxID=52697 RepID=UPI0024A1EA92|nr:hypothetical protein [Actinoplanes regularis]GLW32299.1 hypothetical protein Areg01_52380 [Actinoplanes regularis]
MNLDQFTAPLLAFWQEWGAAVLLGAGVIGLIGLLAAYAEAKRARKPLRPIALAFSMNLALLLNAEGMWVIATGDLQLPKVFAVLVFAVFEICFLTATSLAAEQYRRTTVYKPDGTIATPGHPGPMLWIAALIAGVSGVIVASNAHTGTEKLLRLAVPCVIFLMWWAALTAAGQRRRRGRFAYSPRRLAERWGWLIPDDDPDLAKMAADRQVRRMVVNHQRAGAGRWPKALWRSRLLKDARTADRAVVDQVVAQLARIDEVMTLLGPIGRAPGAETPRTETPSAESAGAGVLRALAARERALRVRESRLRRRARTAHHVTHVRTAQKPRRDPRSAQEKEVVVAALRMFAPARSLREVARLADLPESTVRGYLPRTSKPESAQQTKTNGNVPDLEGASR